MEKETSKKKNEKFHFILNNKVVPYFSKIGSQRHLLGIRNGIISSLPFVLVGSIFTIILNFPISGDNKYLSSIMSDELRTTLDLLYRFTMGIMAIFIAVGIGAELARLSRLSSTQGATIGLLGYIMWMLPFVISFQGTVDIEALKSAGVSSEQIELIQNMQNDLVNLKGGLWINLKSLGATSVFVAIVGSTIAVEIYRICVKYNITIRLPKQVPEAVGNSFLAMIPIMLIAILVGFIRYVVGFDMVNFLKDVFTPFGNFLVNNIGGALIVIFLITFLWWFGIHGGSLVQSVTRPFWLKALEENQLASQAQMKIPNDLPEPFFQWFAQYGGAGSTLGLVIVGAIFAKSKLVKASTRTSLVPGIFNINEPILFGLPILVNPFMWIPFVFSPVLGGLVGYGLQKAMGIHWVALVPWTLPGPIGAYFASGGQWQAIIANLIVLGVSVGTWLPFVFWYDRVTLVKEQELERKEIKING